MSEDLENPWKRVQSPNSLHNNFTIQKVSFDLLEGEMTKYKVNDQVENVSNEMASVLQESELRCAGQIDPSASLKLIIGRIKWGKATKHKTQKKEAISERIMRVKWR